jgi:hypothetical protein
MPNRARLCIGSGEMSRPEKTTSPESGRTRPTIMLKVVVLPAPFGPSNPTISPEFTWMLTPFTTRRFLNDLTRPRTSSSSSPRVGGAATTMGAVCRAGRPSANAGSKSSSLDAGPTDGRERRCRCAREFRRRCRLLPPNGKSWAGSLPGFAPGSVSGVPVENLCTGSSGRGGGCSRRGEARQQPLHNRAPSAAGNFCPSHKSFARSILRLRRPAARAGGWTLGSGPLGRTFPLVGPKMGFWPVEKHTPSQARAPSFHGGRPRRGWGREGPPSASARASARAAAKAAAEAPGRAAGRTSGRSSGGAGRAGAHSPRS